MGIGNKDILGVRRLNDELLCSSEYKIKERKIARKFNSRISVVFSLGLHIMPNYFCFTTYIQEGRD